MYIIIRVFYDRAYIVVYRLTLYSVVVSPFYIKFKIKIVQLSLQI